MTPYTAEQYQQKKAAPTPTTTKVYALVLLWLIPFFHRTLNVALLVFTLQAFALVVVLLPLRHADQDFGIAMLEIHPQWHNGQTFFSQADF